jgi:hypothetical protein
LGRNDEDPTSLFLRGCADATDALEDDLLLDGFKHFVVVVPSFLLTMAI